MSSVNLYRELPVNSYLYGTAMTANAQFLSIVDGTALTGISVTCNVFDPDNTLVVSAGSATEPIPGLYRYTLAAVSHTKRGTWIFSFSTTNATADGKTVMVEVKSV